MTKLQEVFIENLKLARKQANFTQEDLAEKVGLTPKHISVIERRVKFPTIQMLEAIADALGIPAYKLFIDPNNMNDGSPTEIVDLYNRFLEERIKRELVESGSAFLQQRTPDSN